ncbi:MAG: response regulator [Rhizomicrobium sp.]
MVDSEIGKGTTFRIYLPRHRIDANAALAVEPERAGPRDVTGQDTILLVEDEEAVRSFAARALKMRGYSVLEASGGEEALEIVKNAKAPIDLLITDVVMPNMDGPTLVRAVKRIKPEMAVIFMSGLCRRSLPPQRREGRGPALPAQAVRAEATRGQGEGSAQRRADAEAGVGGVAALPRPLSGYCAARGADGGRPTDGFGPAGPAVFAGSKRRATTSNARSPKPCMASPIDNHKAIETTSSSRAS